MNFCTPFIDVSVTSKNLKTLPEGRSITVKEYDSAELSISEPRPAYGISTEILDFIHKNASESIRSALMKYFVFSL